MGIKYIGENTLKQILKSSLKNDYDIKTELEANINKKASNEELKIERERIDSIVKNTGTSVDDLELQDIRIGYSGESYSSAGDAVRGQSLKIKSKIDEINIDKLSQRYVNLVKVFKKASEPKANDATFEKKDNGKYVVTSTSTWGQLYFNYTIEDVDVKKVAVFSKYRRISENCVSSGISTYQYDENNTNLGESKEFTTVYENPDNEYCYGFAYSGIKQNTKKISFSPFILSSNNSIAECDDNCLVVIDASEMSLDECKEFWEEYFLKESELRTGFDKWGIYPNIVHMSENSKKAEIAEKAISTEYANNSKSAQRAKSEEIIIASSNKREAVYGEWRNENLFTANGDGTYTVKPTISYGAISVKPTIKYAMNKKYIIAWKSVTKADGSEVFIRAGFIIGGKWNYLDDTPKSIETKNGKVIYSVLKINESITDLNRCYINSSYTPGEEYKFKPLLVCEVENDFDVTGNIVKEIIEDGVDICYELSNHSERLEALEEKTSRNTDTWYGKKALVIGDSITAAGRWQRQIEKKLGMEVTTHAKGGVGTIAMVDGDKGLGGNYDNITDAGGVLKPLVADDVADKDIIIVLPAYNDRGKPDGEVGDLFHSSTTENTISGMIQYTINRIYEELEKAGNLTCKVMYATPHCAGKYPWIDADGYENWKGTQEKPMTMETLGNAIKSVCNYNNIPVCDLWHESGINKFTWKVFGKESEAVNENYSPYELNSSGNKVSDTRIKYIKGQSYYQKRGDSIVLEEYTGDSPYPYNRDQLHCSDLGYKRIGECICGAVINYFGN